MKAIETITVQQERIGQYATFLTAHAARRRLQQETGLAHLVCKTKTWRDLCPLICYTVMVYPRQRGDVPHA